MKNAIPAVLLIAALAGCSGEEEAPASKPPEAGAPAVAAEPGTTRRAQAEHGAHTVTAAPAAPEHGAHPPAASAATHRQHTAAAQHNGQHRAQAAQHARHAEGVAHAQQRDSSTRQRDTAHMQHRDTAHMQHRDTAHVRHRRDPTHAQQRDTTHAQHRDTTHVERRDTAHAQHGAAQDPKHMHHPMVMVPLAKGWMVLGMVQVFPTATIALPAAEGTPLAHRGVYLTQPAIMANIESPGSRLTLRTTINLEGLTQPQGELTFGGWGEGFIDKRHPHTYLHELLLSANFFQSNGRGASISVGKGFAPYGTDDPMMRPVVKYPTNHHLSQILERWTINGVYVASAWSVEAGWFGGNEPTSATDLSNIESFGNSWSARVTRRIGTPEMGRWPWEISGSFGHVKEEHDGAAETTRLYNLAVRHEHDHGMGRLYTLVEASRGAPEHHDGYYSVAAEGSLISGVHKPYVRMEVATRPEFHREGLPDRRGFFRYHHDAEPIGSTRWLTVAAGYGVTATSLPFSVRPYIEAQWNRVSEHRGGIDPAALFGRSSFLMLSAGFRIFLGGEPMRMGTYGVLDPMTAMHRMQMSTRKAQHH